MNKIEVVENKTKRNKKRRRTKYRELSIIGDQKGGRMYFPHTISSYRAPSGSRILHGFRLITQYVFKSNEEVRKELDIRITVGYERYSLSETIFVEVPDTPIFFNPNLWQVVDDRQIRSLAPDLVVPLPRKLVTPTRKTLDNYGLDVSMFRSERYLGIPICLATRNKENINEGWLYVYATVVNDVEGICFEADSKTPVVIIGNIQNL
ncbi:hypothetical protein [Caldibacillus debilis]|uniref:Uncharacterized protein n=1 Tax=Caldibacillus debilis GB1 TaxID=1339248 RepID=A0A420VEN8_9BACI|nr:hypothetical protein [Caldibacillus debilis]RKO61833.1 hypothetical protein Cdeb_01328 [Caldibacillus debilis GB1]